MYVCDYSLFEQQLQPIEALLLNVIYSKVKNGDIAKEIYHNAIVSGLSHFFQLKDIKKFPAWMFRIAQNEIKLYFRNEHTRRNAETVMDIQDPLNAPVLQLHTHEYRSVESIVLDRSEKRKLEEAVT